MAIFSKITAELINHDVKTDVVLKNSSVNRRDENKIFHSY